LVDLLIGLIARINARAERRVENEISAEAKKVHGKTGKLFRIAAAAIARPDDTVRTVVYPVVDELTLRRLVAEAKADEKAFKARVQTVLTSSYSNYYRRMLPKLLAALDFKCNNTAYRPVMDALELLHTYAGAGSKAKHYDAADRVPIKGMVPGRVDRGDHGHRGPALSASPTSCACWCRWPTRCAAGRSMSRAPSGGVIRRRTRRAISRTTATSPTTTCVNPWTPGSSSPA
jgi:hypothetical protein